MYYLHNKIRKKIMINSSYNINKIINIFQKKIIFNKKMKINTKFQWQKMIYHKNKEIIKCNKNNLSTVNHKIKVFSN